MKSPSVLGLCQQVYKEMIGYHFSEYRTEMDQRAPFEKLLDIFLELVTHTSGDVEEALDWLKQLDKEYNLTDDNYSLDDFIAELEQKGYIRQKDQGKGGRPVLGWKGEQAVRQKALNQIFGKLKKSGVGQHKTMHMGRGDETTENRRPYRFGDKLEQIDFSESFKNAQINHGIGEFSLLNKAIMERSIGFSDLFNNLFSEDEE